ncbi:MAG: hypothetical protein FWE14_04890 [Lachnospiraceae bacterium]|nr:hypothetical protein [Lachnospiraceae bacterium]
MDYLNESHEELYKDLIQSSNEEPQFVYESFHKHYIRKADEENEVYGCFIVFGFSDAFEQPIENDVLISENGSYQFRLFPDGEENPKLFDDNGVPLYRYHRGKVRIRSKKELEEHNAAISKQID